MANMTRRRTKVLLSLVGLLLLVCAIAFAGCNSGNNVVNLGGSGAPTEPTHFIAKFLVILNDGIGNFGWTVVVFTIILKLILSPLDIWQKFVARKNAKIMRRMKPQLDKLADKCGDDKQRYQQEQMALMKKEKYSTFGSCLPMIITMVVFFVVFAGFNQMVSFQNAKVYTDARTNFSKVYTEQAIFENYTTLKNEANWTVDENNTYATIFKADNGYKFEFNKKYDDMSVGEKAVADKAKSLFETSKASVLDKAQTYVSENFALPSFLWVKNIFIPDTWKPAIPNYETFSGQSGMAQTKINGVPISEYNMVMGKVLGTHGYAPNGSWNGLLLFPLFSILLNFASQWLMTKAQGPQPGTGKKDEKGGQQMAGASKAMQYVMPLMMGVFALMYSTAFTVYMFVNALVTILFQLAFNLVTYLIDKKNGDLPPKEPKQKKVKVKKA